MRTAIDPEHDETTSPALQTERQMDATAAQVHEAWAGGFGRWFAEPDTVLMRGEVDAPYFFETLHDGVRYPHYGRFIELVRGRRVAMTWTNSVVGGAETVVAVEMVDSASGCALVLRHGGFPDEETRDQTAEAWPHVLDHLDQILTRE
jgi:uncharacterized protein YndB with AHSA1/START domain